MVSLKPSDSDSQGAEHILQPKYILPNCILGLLHVLVDAELSDWILVLESTVNSLLVSQTRQCFHVLLLHSICPLLQVRLSVHSTIFCPWR